MRYVLLLMLLCCRLLSLQAQSFPDLRATRQFGTPNAFAYPKKGASARMRIATPCADTSFRRYFYEDSTGIGVSQICLLRDGSMVLPGGYIVQQTPQWIYNGYLIKLTASGDTSWIRRLDAGFPGRGCGLYRVQELRNRDLLVVGSLSIPVPYNGTSDLFLARLSANGDPIWHRTFANRRFRDTTSGEFDIRDIAETPSGDIYLCGAGRGDAINRGALLMKFGSNGTYKWSTDILFDGLPIAHGLEVSDTSVQMVASGSTGSSLYGATNTMVFIRYNPQNGDTLSLRAWGLPLSGTSWLKSISGSMHVRRLADGRLRLAGTASGLWWTPFNQPDTGVVYHCTVFDFDASDQPLGGYCLKSYRRPNDDYCRANLLDNGDLVYTQMYYISGYCADMATTYVSNGQILQERVLPYRGISTIYTSRFVQQPNGGFLATRQNYDSATGKFSAEFLRFNLSDTGGSCLGDMTSLLQADTVRLPVRYRLFVSEVVRNKVIETLRPYTGMIPERVNIRQDSCRQVPVCNSLQLLASDTLLCSGTPLTLRIRRNTGCGAQPAWSYPTSGVQQFATLNDSTVQVTFSNAWQGRIVGSIGGCTRLSDSVFVRVLPSEIPPELGNPPALCPGNSLQLKAGPGYASYVWQDNSNDSVLTVSASGTYWVRVTDACGRIFADTATVMPRAPILLDAGPDRDICPGDTALLQAPSGFSAYEWSNNYRISNLSGPAVRVYPLADTAYFLRAEKEPGCFAFDTVRIRVHVVPPLQISPGRSFCTGDSLVFAAPPGFSSYNWSTGVSTPSIVVRSAGTYWLQAITAAGCRRSDSARVPEVYPAPRPSLDRTEYLCVGSTRLLDPGPFAAYLWNDNSTTRTRSAGTTGLYSVQVTDAHGCTARDSTQISRLVSLPANFLPADTPWCSWERLQLQPAGVFARYSWSNGAVTPLIEVTGPGSFSLTVTDEYGCSGTEQVRVYARDCMYGFYVPTSFTPNNDGRNDRFHPLVFGPVAEYDFAIYSRWGEVVFRSSNPTEGWDGRLRGLLQDNNLFVWTCRYRFANGPVKQEKGTVLLVR